MNHVPLVTVVRGDPATVVAQIECETGSVSTVQVFVRITDAGKPTPIDMERQGDGTYQAIVPIALIRGINRFWYYIDARGKSTPDQAEEGVAQTRWNPVTIVDGALDNAAGAGAAAGVGAGASGGSGVGGSKKALYWLLGGAGAVGGALLLENHNDNGGGVGNPPPPPPSTPPPTSNQNDDDEEEEEEEEEPAPPVIPPCIPTGSASASPASACSTTDPIVVEVCSSCPNSLIEVSSSWGPVVSRSGYNNEGCGAEPADPFELPQPPGVPNINEGEFTITVRANGQIIGTIPWPDEGYFNCF